MLKIQNVNEFVNENNEKVAHVTLSDNNVFELTDYMFIDFEGITHTTHKELLNDGFVKITN